MTITVKHTKVSAISDGTDTTVVRPSDWNADHSLVGLGTMAEQNANSIAVTGGTINGTTVGATTATTGAFTTVTASTSLTTPTVQATNSGGLSLKNSAGTTQISMGAGGGDNVSVNVSTNLNGTNAQIDLSPTGTGHVHINPTGVNSIQINPTYVGTIDNMTIGATIPKNGSFVDLSVTGTVSFDALQGTAGQVLTSAGTGVTPTWATPTTGTVTSVAATAGTGISVSGSPITTSGTLTITNTAPDQTVALTASTGISVTGTYPSFTITNTSPSSGGTVTSVSGTTGRITSTGGATPVIDLASGVATAGTTGSSTLIPVVTIDTYGRVTSITTASNPQGTVTSVTGTAPVVSSGGATPAISMAAATTSVDGYLTSTDWNTFNGKQAAFGSQTANYFYAAPNGSAGSPTFRAVVAADIPTLNQNTTGNAGTVTNGVYTTGSYADPTWITSLAGSKITGTISGGTF